MKYIPILLLLSLLNLSCAPDQSNKTDYEAPRTSDIITVDGLANEAVWSESSWNSINEVWLGTAPSDDDFSGRFKISWDEDHLYVLAEITDDSLYHPYEGIEGYWNNDILEIFVDEDASGGDHQYNYNAFAYHIDQHYDVFDMHTDSSAYYYNDHVETQITRAGNTYTWEAAIRIYDDSFQMDGSSQPVSLRSGKVMGFALAYCDNDSSELREHFIGSEVIEGEDKNRGWIDAGVFGTLKLTD